MEEVVRVSVYCSFVSLICGLASLLLPLLALWKRKHTAALAAISMGLCAVSLLGQIFDYNVHVYAGDMSTLLDISAAIRFCATALVVLAAAANLAVALYSRLRRSE